MNAPQNISLLNPGQCIRVAIYATGEHREDYLKQTKLLFRIQLAGHTDAYPLGPFSIFKQIKPEGGDFVAGVLAVAGVKMPDEAKTMASMGVSPDHWCVPLDAPDGTATVDTEVESPAGRQQLTASTVQVESFESGSKKAFKSSEEFGSFVQTYYRQPNPARLIPALQFMVADQTEHPKAGQAEITAAFLAAALRSDANAGENFRQRLPGLPPMARALGLLALRSAGFDIASVLNTMSADEREKFQGLPPLQDPFDLSPTPDLFQHLDMMWAVYGATGEIKPVQTIASTLAWRSDYEDFDRMRKSPNHPSTLTPSIIRAVVYTAAGWSLSSFQRSDPLAADYIDYLRESPGTPDAVKSELGALSTNPAFKQPGGR